MWDRKAVRAWQKHKIEIWGEQYPFTDDYCDIKNNAQSYKPQSVHSSANQVTCCNFAASSVRRTQTKYEYSSIVHEQQSNDQPISPLVEPSNLSQVPCTSNPRSTPGTKQPHECNRQTTGAQNTKNMNFGIKQLDIEPQQKQNACADQSTSIAECKFSDCEFLPKKLQQALIENNHIFMRPFQQLVLKAMLPPSSGSILATSAPHTGKMISCILASIAHVLHITKLERESGISPMSALNQPIKGQGQPKQQPKVIVLSSTGDRVKLLGQMCNNLRTFVKGEVVVFDASPQEEYCFQVTRMPRNADILITTPARLNEYCLAYKVGLDKVSLVCLDRLPCLIRQSTSVLYIDKLLQEVKYRKDARLLFFSDRSNNMVEDFVQKHNHDNQIKLIDHTSTLSPLAHLKQQFGVFFTPAYRLEMLYYKLLEVPGRAIVVLQDDLHLQLIASKLQTRGINAVSYTLQTATDIHLQHERDRIIQGFADERVPVLVVNEQLSGFPAMGDEYERKEKRTGVSTTFLLETDLISKAKAIRYFLKLGNQECPLWLIEYLEAAGD